MIKLLDFSKTFLLSFLSYHTEGLVDFEDFSHRFFGVSIIFLALFNSLVQNKNT